MVDSGVGSPIATIALVYRTRAAKRAFHYCTRQVKLDCGTYVLGVLR